MIRAFNAFQFNVVLVVWPFVIGWLSEQNTGWSSAAFYASCILFGIQFLIASACVSNSFKDL
jgi:hypothetical protein